MDDGEGHRRRWRFLTICGSNVSARGLCLLVTSREPLGIGGHVFRVPPPSIPPADLAAPGQLAAFESVQLLTEHAAMHRPGFVLDEDNAAAVSEVSSRLDQRLRLLTGRSRTALPRHQTLRALID